MLIFVLKFFFEGKCKAFMIRLGFLFEIEVSNKRVVIMSYLSFDGKKLTWDEIVSPSYYDKWKVMFKEMF